jgi:hypothetical protein
MWRLISGGRILRVGLEGDDEVVEVGGWDLRCERWGKGV